MDWTAAEPARPSNGGLPANELNAESERQSLGSRVHGYTLMFVVGVVQLAWLMTLGYALLRLFS